MLAGHREGDSRILETAPATKMTRTQSKASSILPPTDDVPQPGDFDDDLENWEVEARGANATAPSLTIAVTLEGDTFRAIVNAANVEGMDAQQYLQRAVDALAKTLPQP
jgi:hypothetical protein